MNSSIYVPLSWMIFSVSFVDSSSQTHSNYGKQILRDLKPLSWKHFFPIRYITHFPIASTTLFMPQSLKSISSHLLNQYCHLFPPESLSRLEVTAWSQVFSINAFFPAFQTVWCHHYAATQRPNVWIIFSNIHLLD